MSGVSTDLWIAVMAAGLAVLIFVFVGLLLLRRFWLQYQADYVEGTAVALDSMYINMPAQNLLYLGFLCAVILMLTVGLLSGNPLAALPFGVLGMILPKVVIRILKSKRDRVFNEQLIDALMNVSNSLRAGFSLPQALELVHQEMPNPMSQEIRLVCQELRLGLPIEEALDHLYRRMPSDDLDLVVTAIAIVRDVGGNLTEVFDNIAQTIRERLRIEGKIRSLTAQGRLQAIVVCMLPVVVLVGLHFIDPGLLASLYQTLQGWVILGAVLGLELAAILIIRKIVDIKV